jgi:hypothetical protein
MVFVNVYIHFWIWTRIWNPRVPDPCGSGSTTLVAGTSIFAVPLPSMVSKLCLLDIDDGEVLAGRARSSGLHLHVQQSGGGGRWTALALHILRFIRYRYYIIPFSFLFHTVLRSRIILMRLKLLFQKAQKLT